jgi:hypothetical protein
VGVSEHLTHETEGTIVMAHCLSDWIVEDIKKLAVYIFGCAES